MAEKDRLDKKHLDIITHLEMEEHFMKYVGISFMVVGVIKIIVSAIALNILGVLVGVGCWNLGRHILKLDKKEAEAKVRRGQFKEVK